MRGSCQCWAGYSGPACDVPGPRPNGDSPIGMNLAGIGYGLERVYVDVMKHSTPWVSVPGADTANTSAQQYVWGDGQQIVQEPSGNLLKVCAHKCPIIALAIVETTIVFKPGGVRVLARLLISSTKYCACFEHPKRIPWCHPSPLRPFRREPLRSQVGPLQAVVKLTLRDLCLHAASGRCPAHPESHDAFSAPTTTLFWPYPSPCQCPA